MKLAPQQIINKLLLRLLIHSTSLILEDQIIIPSPLDCESTTSRSRTTIRGSMGGSFGSESGGEVEKGITGCD